MDKAFEIQKQVRDNANTLNSYLTDLQNWEKEMKRKETALNGGYEQDLPPVRSKVKREKPVVVKKPPPKRIPSSDYKAWENFDVDKACEDIDMEDKGPTSLDSKKSSAAKMEKLREEAQYEKERGNTFVKQEKWDEAIKCYNRAIELVKDDAIYYANRGLCHLKKDSLHQAESDCTEALRLDPTYVKALQRRATAREKLGSLRSAATDLTEVLRLEPHNKAARAQLDGIKARMGTKGNKSKSSPSSTPTVESKPIIPKSRPQLETVEMTDKPRPGNSFVTAWDSWRMGGGDSNITVLKTVKKPPHLRSKRPLKSVPIQEIKLGHTLPEKPPTRLKIEEIEDQPHGDNKDCSKMDNEGSKTVLEQNEASPESVKLITDAMVTEKQQRVTAVVAPVNSVQFMAEWKQHSGDDEARSLYLSIIDPSKLPSIFANALESDVLSELIRVLALNPSKYSDKSVAAYLRGLSGVKRFSALAMFLSDADKLLLNKLLDHCKTAENCAEDVIADLKNKYEL